MLNSAKIGYTGELFSPRLGFPVVNFTPDAPPTGSITGHWSESRARKCFRDVGDGTVLALLCGDGRTLTVG